jgi:hypothetical protein
MSRELAAVVHAETLGGVADLQRLDAPAFAHRALDDVGQVELALLVAVVELAERLPEQLGVEEVHARVAFLDAELLLRRVGLLDDAPHAAVRPAHDEAGQRRRRSQHGEVRARLRLVLCQRAQRLLAQQRHVAVEDEHVAGEAAQRGLGLLHGVAGAVLLRLHDEPRAARELLLHLLPVAADDHHQVLGLQGLGRADRPAEQRPAAELVEDLRATGVHPRALPGRQDDHRQRSLDLPHLSLFPSPSASARSRGTTTVPLWVYPKKGKVRANPGPGIP